MTTSKGFLEKLRDCMLAFFAVVMLVESWIIMFTTEARSTEGMLGVTMCAVALLIISRLHETSWEKDEEK